MVARAREAGDLPWKKLDRGALLTAIGVDPVSGLIGPGGQMIGRMADMIEAGSWVGDLNLTQTEIIDVIREVMAKKPDGPPLTFLYFTNAMQRFAGQKNRPTLKPIEGGQNERTSHSDRRQYTSEASRAHQVLIAGFARAVSDEP